MEFKSSNPKFTKKFISHFKSYIEGHELFQPNDQLLITVSGGIDSMAIVYALKELRSCGYSNELRVAHINHGTRLGQDSESKLVQDYCGFLNIPFEKRVLKDLNPNKNFEYRARVKRYDAFYEIAKPRELIILAHHIDDSFEWTLLQSLRSSSIEGLIGIPAKNNRIIRPFMCVTKKQIENFVKYFDLPFIEDPTNESLKYERNFIRNEIVSAFKDRHPKYLKHYVFRHNEIARRLGLHLIDKNKSDFSIKYGEKSALIYNLDGGSDFSGVGELVLKAVKHLNPNSRGSLNQQLQKIEQALKNYKLGPLNLVGDLKAYLDFNLVLITNESEKPLEVMNKNYQTFSYNEFINFLRDYILNQKFHLDFPFIVLIKGSYLDKRDFNISFNTDNLNQFRSSDTIYYPALKLLREWSKKRNRHKVLRLNFLTSV